MNTKAKNFIVCGGLAVCAFLAILGVGFMEAEPISAFAEESLTASNASLVLPNSHEEYLALAAPKDIAFSEQYVAIADGGTLFLYDREAKEYFSTSLEAGRTITEIAFAGNRLFVADTGVSNYFYEYNFSTRALMHKANINFSTFCVDGDTLYTATVSAETRIGAYSISSLSEANPTATYLGTISKAITPYMTVMNGTLHCTFGETVYRYDGTEKFTSYFLSSTPSYASNLRSVCAYKGQLYYTAEGGFYRSDSSAEKPATGELLLRDPDLGQLAVYGDSVYCIYKGTVRGLTIEGNTAHFNDFEISAASSSVNRLNGAVDTARAGNLLVTADAGNSRITIAEIAREGDENAIARYSQIECLGGDGRAYTPTHVATDGALIAVSSADSHIYLYRYGKQTYDLCYVLDTPATGLACVYGACYFITEYSYGKAESGFVPFTRSANAPLALASDVYGTLYVVGADGSAQSYTESAFINRLVQQGTPVHEGTVFPKDLACLRADFEGNLYYLSGGKLYRTGTPIATFSASESFVYGEVAGMPLSYALGFEDDEVYFLFENYMVKTAPNAIEIPTLNEISTAGIYEEVFAPHDAENLLIDIPAGTIGIRTDLDELKEGTTTFPYSSYFRTEEENRGILLSQTNGYALVILYEIEENTRTFTANLFRLNAELPLVPQDNYWEAENADMYLTNTVSAYYFPCLYPTLAGEQLARGTRVHVLGYVQAPERIYALITTDFAQDTKSAVSTFTAFIPVSYLTSAAPLPETEARYEPAWLKAVPEGVLLTAEDGDTVLITDRTRAEFVENADGTFTARIYLSGKAYTATVTDNMIDRGDSDAVRISLIVILSILAVTIVGGYVLFLPRKNDRIDVK
ncbi:MAG: hypothetical protein IKD43_01670 [Clostridia bacterium]|nr:hypothetical protein [Clostridia bacterium]